MTKDEYYIKIAEAVCLKSKCFKKHYGSVIVKNDTVISTGYNGTARGETECIVCTKVDVDKDYKEYSTCPAIHSEMNAIISASREEMLGSTLYLAGWDVEKNQFIEAKPCEICLRLIKNAGINRVVNSAGTLYLRNNLGILEKIEAK